VAVGGELAERFDGHCANCARFRTFTFRMSDKPHDISFDIRYGIGDEPSRLLDPGEWLGVSELYDLAASERLAAGELNEDDEVTRLYYLLTSALAAAEEIMKFLPPGEDTVPESAFWTQPGRLVFEAVPERFTRASLANDTATLRQKVADFESAHPDDTPSAG
jgi:hypothetical protein